MHSTSALTERAPNVRATGSAVVESCACGAPDLCPGSSEKRVASNPSSHDALYVGSRNHQYSLRCSYIRGRLCSYIPNRAFDSYTSSIQHMIAVAVLGLVYCSQLLRPPWGLHKQRGPHNRPQYNTMILIMRTPNPDLPTVLN